MIIQTSNSYFISSKYLANMLKGIIIQKNIHFCMRVSRCTTAKLFPISVSYLSRPICPLCLFWIKSIAHNNRHFWGTTPLNITSYTAHYTINTLSINLSRISFLLLSLLLSLHYSLNNAWFIMVWHILRWSFFSGIQSKYCENIITKYSLQS